MVAIVYKRNIPIFGCNVAIIIALENSLFSMYFVTLYCIHITLHCN